MSDQIPSPPPGTTPPSAASGGGRYAPPSGYALAPAPVAPYGNPLRPVDGAPVGPAAAGPASAASGALGVIAFVLSLVAAVGTSVVAAVAAYRVGVGAGRRLFEDAMLGTFDWSFLTPVRGDVLWAEIAFWTGTALGIWALVQGIIAIVQRRGRGFGIAAVVIACLGPVVFGLVVQGLLTAGLAAGTGLTG
ncbi:hypothetical protein ABXJ56_00510 [Microbacterium chocolatum]|uniref:hypothetical protein n=1 Tax=Microbacterium aurantiacum TaxID=162393 RepID=UPI00338E1BB7